MRIASFSDIHGNVTALQVVLEDIASQGVDLLVCPGDLVGYGPYPNEVIELIQQHNIATVQGNYDDGVGYMKEGCGCAYRTQIEKETGHQSLEWTKQEVTEENKAYLKSLPNHMLWERDEWRILMVHGSPRKINEYLYEDRPISTLEHMVNPLNVDVLIFGHTHIPYHLLVSKTHLVNDGSVGRPKDNDTRAGYSVIDIRDDVSVEFRRVEYNVSEVAEAMRSRGLHDWLIEYLLNAGSNVD